MTGTNAQALAAALFAQMACMAAATFAAQNSPYAPSPESGAKMRASLHAEGLTNVPGRTTKAPKPVKPTSAELFGFRNGKFVG